MTLPVRKAGKMDLPSLEALFFLGALLLIFSSPAKAAEKIPVPEEKPISMGDRVDNLRDERHAQMPYLDVGYVRSVINRDKVRDAGVFSAIERKSLNDIVARAEEVHVPAMAARERISLAHRRVLVALRNLLPEGNFEWKHQDGDLSGSSFNHQSYQLNFRVPVFRGGILWNTLLQEKAEGEAARKEYDAVIGDLISNVSAAYFEYQRTVQVVRDYADVLHEIDRFADIANKKFDQGLVSEIEHLNVQSLASQAKYDQETAKQEMEVAKLELLKYLDLDYETQISIKELYDTAQLLASKPEPVRGAATTPPAEPSLRTVEKGGESFEGSMRIPELSSLVDLAYQHRPELRVESSRLASARFEERIRWGELLPHADLVFEVGKLGEAFDINTKEPSLRSDLRAQLELSWNMMGNTVGYQVENQDNAPTISQFQQGQGSQIMRHSVTVGMLDGLQKLADAKEAEADRLDQIVQLEEKEKEVILDVKQAYYDYQKAKIQVESSLQRVQYRKRLVSLASFRLEKAEIEISEYLQAQNDLLSELGTLHKALADYFTAKAHLNRAIDISNYLPIEEHYES